MQNAPYANFISDAFDRFSRQDSQERRWEIAQTLVSDFGGNALNVGAIEIDADVPTWMLSSMSQTWLDRYVNEGFYKIDPFIPHVKTSNQPIIIDTEKTVTGQPLNAHLLAAGYHFMFGHPFNGATPNERRIITYASGKSAEKLVTGNFLERVRMLCAILVTQFSAPDAQNDPDVYVFGKRPLSLREKESLKWLANGLRNSEIAFKMGISEITVRKHLIEARKKLGALTREQALGIAIHRQLITL